MHKKIRNELQIFLTLALAVVVLVFLSMSIGVDNSPQTGAVPTVKPTDEAIDEASFLDKMIEQFGISESDIQAAAVNLNVDITPASISRSPGNSVSFTVDIKNNTAAMVSHIVFRSQFPDEFKASSYQFTPDIKRYGSGQTFFIPEIAAGSTLQIKVNGNVAADSCNGSSSYVAQVYGLSEDDENDKKQGSSTLIVNGADGCGDLYMPLISKFPTPTPQPIFFEDNFSDNDNDWPTGDLGTGGDCNARVENGKYEVKVEEDETCFFPAPEDAEKRNGTFEVEFRRDGDSDSDEFDVGIYINGRGGDEFYLFRVEYEENDCEYKLFREDDRKADGSCDSASNGYRETNKLKITRDNGGNITIFLNDRQLRTWRDGSPYSGRGIGFYVRETSKDDKIIIDFDNFRILNE